MKKLSMMFAAFAAVCAFGSPSEDYLAKARELYPTERYAAVTNTVVGEWTIGTGDFADRPEAGGKIGWVALEGMRNFRDIGGWNGLKAGRVFRGSEPDSHRPTKMDNPHWHCRATENDLETLTGTLGIKTDLDLRRVNECPNLTASALGVRLVRVPVRPYMEYFDTTNEWAAVMRVFADARNFPIYFHCWGGADRTGILAVLLEALGGASEADVTIDYELTTFSGFPRARDPGGRAGKGFLKFFDRIRACEGATLSEKTAAFLKGTLGLTDDEIAAIKANLTEGDKPSATAVKRGEIIVSKLDRVTKSDWSPMAYETLDGLKGSLLAATWGAPDYAKAEIPLPVRGRYRIFLAMGGARFRLEGAPIRMLVRLKRDPAPVYMDAVADSRTAGFWIQPVENEWKTVDLDGDTLVVEKPRNSNSILCWIRLVPADEEPKKEYKHDLIATNDAYMPSGRFDELLAPIMKLSGTAVSEIHYCVGNGAFAFAVPSKIAIPCTFNPKARYGSAWAKQCAETYTRLWKEHPDLLNELADFTHARGMKFCVSFRTGPALDHMCFYEQGRGATPVDKVDAFRDPANYCRHWDKTPVNRLSYAKDEVQDLFLRFYAEMLTDKVDGISLLWVRGMPAMLFEPAFREKFEKRYGQKLRNKDDPRVLDLRAEILTDYHRRVRKLAGNRRVVLFIPPSRESCRTFGLDLRRLAEEGLADEFVINYAIQTAYHDESTDYFDFDFLREVTAGTKTRYRACMWGSEGEYTKAVREGAVGMAWWDAANRSWPLWEQLRLLGDEDGAAARQWVKDNPPGSRVHTLKTLNGFDYSVYPWHTAY